MVEAITGALDKSDCEVLNLSCGPNYGKAEDHAAYEKAEDGSPEKIELEKKIRYGYQEDLDASYIESKVEWLNTVGRVILEKGVLSAPVVVSAGNDAMHEMEKIIDKMDPKCRALLGSRLVIVSAQQNEHLADYQKDYSNRVSSKVKGVMTVNIDGVTSHDGKHYLMGTSFAAPTLVRYLYQIVEASKEGGNPMSYQAAIELLTKLWMEGSQTAWTDQAIGDLVAMLRSGATSLEAKSRYGEYYVLPEQRGYGTAFTHVKNQYEDYNYYKLEITSGVPIDTPRLIPSDS